MNLKTILQEIIFNMWFKNELFTHLNIWDQAQDLIGHSTTIETTNSLVIHILENSFLWNIQILKE